MGCIYRIVERTSHNLESVIAALKLRIANNNMWNKQSETDNTASTQHVRGTNMWNKQSEADNTA